MCVLTFWANEECMSRWMMLVCIWCVEFHTQPTQVDDKDERVKKLERIARACGVLPFAKNYKLAFEHCQNNDERSAKLKQMLRDAGMTGEWKYFFVMTNYLSELSLAFWLCNDNGKFAYTTVLSLSWLLECSISGIAWCDRSSACLLKMDMKL